MLKSFVTFRTESGRESGILRIGGLCPVNAEFERASEISVTFEGKSPNFDRPHTFLYGSATLRQVKNSPYIFVRRAPHTYAAHTHVYFVLRVFDTEGRESAPREVSQTDRKAFVSRSRSRKGGLGAGACQLQKRDACLLGETTASESSHHRARVDIFAHLHRAVGAKATGFVLMEGPSSSSSSGIREGERTTAAAMVAQQSESMSAVPSVAQVHDHLLPLMSNRQRFRLVSATGLV